jgi:Undecaprenyl-phosphate glucose phosphotransferase
MAIATLLNSESRAKPGTIPLVVVAAVLRVVDVAMIIITAQAIRPFFTEHAGVAPYYGVAAVLAALLAVIVLHVNGLYRLKGLSVRHLREQLTQLSAGLGEVLLILIVTMFALKISDTFSRLWIGSWFVLVWLEMALTRLLLVLRARHWAAQGRFLRNVAIVGFHQSTDPLIERLSRDDSVRIIGCFDERVRRDPSLPMPAGVARLGTPADLIEYARRYRVDHVIIALPWSATDRIIAVARQLSVLPIDVSLAPDKLGLSLIAMPIALGDVSLLGIVKRPLGDGQHFIKRAFDCLGALILLTALAPLMALVGALIKLESRGPVFFRQRRHGFNNELVGVTKFRTMYTHLSDPAGEKLTERDDPRVTKLGRLLRRTSIDELPQLFDVLRGDMSLVGPRPHPTKAKAAGRYYQEVVADYAARHRVKPGITGWAQVNGWRGETATEEQILKRIEHDLFYINNWSFWLDLKILFLTAAALVKDSRGKAF